MNGLNFVRDFAVLCSLIIELRCELERKFLHYAQEAHRAKSVSWKPREVKRTLTIAKVSGSRDDEGIFVIDEMQTREYTEDKLKKAEEENPNLIEILPILLAHLNEKGLLLNPKNTMSKTGFVLFIVLSFILLESRKVDENLTSISVIVLDMVENRQDEAGGLSWEAHRRFKPWTFTEKDGTLLFDPVWTLGAITHEKGPDFFRDIAQILRDFARKHSRSLILFTSKGAVAGLKSKVLPKLSERNADDFEGVDIACRGHLSNTTEYGKKSIQVGTHDILENITGSRPKHGEGLNSSFKRVEMKKSFASDIMFKTVSINASPVTSETVSKDVVFGKFVTTESKVQAAAAKARRESAKCISDVQNVMHNLIFEGIGANETADEKDIFAKLESLTCGDVNTSEAAFALSELCQDIRDIDEEENKMYLSADIKAMNEQHYELLTSRTSAITDAYRLLGLISSTINPAKGNKKELETLVAEREKKQSASMFAQLQEKFS